MAFQFLCPQGHLLQADASQMGCTINCPTCGVLFVVPTVTTAAAVQPVIQVPPVAPPAPPATTESEPSGADPLDLNLRGRRGRRRAQLDFGQSDDEEIVEQGLVEEDIPDLAAGNRPVFGGPDSALRLVHLHCPKGHELITPLDTMGQEVLCPHCGEQFLLRNQDTVEYKTKHQLKEDIREQKLGRKWLIMAIFVGVLVLAMFIGMMMQ